MTRQKMPSHRPRGKSSLTKAAPPEAIMFESQDVWVYPNLIFFVSELSRYIVIAS